MASRSVTLAARRRSLVRLLVALMLFRAVTTVAELAEASLNWFSLLITVGLGLETWRMWQVSRAARRQEAVPMPPSRWDRVLRPLERYGPAVVAVLGVAFVVAYAWLAIEGTPRDTLLDITAVVREVVLLVFLVVLLMGYRSIRDARSGGTASEAAAGPQTR